MYESIEFTKVPGKVKNRDVTILALSTCGFCKRALTYLSDNDVAYRYAYVDKVDPETKQSIIDEFKAKYHERPRYPTIILDNDEYEIGFKPSSWAARLGLDA